MSQVLFGPSNPYNPRTVNSRKHIACWDSGQFPGAINTWIQNNISIWPKEDPWAFSTVFSPDQVQCRVEMGYSKSLTTSKYDHKDPFIDSTDGSCYELYLTVIQFLPAKAPSAFPAVYPSLWDQMSPRAILDSWYGAKDSERPQIGVAACLGETYVFSQPRCTMSEAFACMAFWKQNQHENLSTAMIEWAQSTLLVNQALQSLSLLLMC
ncbi:hypothetical protein C8J56DRAFT_890114 [Mycena floridula]|nr:hypothetical protein C8J56DRAFT_890114 [Mycena floridula]